MVHSSLLKNVSEEDIPKIYRLCKILEDRIDLELIGMAPIPHREDVTVDIPIYTLRPVDSKGILFNEYVDLIARLPNHIEAEIKRIYDSGWKDVIPKCVGSGLTTRFTITLTPW